MSPRGWLCRWLRAHRILPEFRLRTNLVKVANSLVWPTRLSRTLEALKLLIVTHYHCTKKHGAFITSDKRYVCLVGETTSLISSWAELSGTATRIGRTTSCSPVGSARHRGANGGVKRGCPRCPDPFHPRPSDRTVLAWCSAHQSANGGGCVLRELSERYHSWGAQDLSVQSWMPWGYSPKNRSQLWGTAFSLWLGPCFCKAAVACKAFSGLPYLSTFPT